MVGAGRMVRGPLLLAALIGWPGTLGAQEQAHAAFRLDEALETSWARSAAPPEIANDAALYLLGDEGYERVFSGTNGFACLVLRSWSPLPGRAADLQRPEIARPICYDPVASQTVLPLELHRASLVMAGVDGEAIEDSVRELAEHRLAKPGSGLAFAHMQSNLSPSGAQPAEARPTLLLFTVGNTGRDPVPHPGVGATFTRGEPWGPIISIAIPLAGPRYEPRPEEDPMGAGQMKATLLRETRGLEERLLADLAGLSEVEWTLRPEPDGWSVAETLEHIAAVEEAIVNQLSRRVTSPESVQPSFVSDHPDARVRLRLLDRGIRFQTIPSMVPTGRFGDVIGAQAAFRRSRAAFLTLTGQVTSDWRHIPVRDAARFEGTQIDAYQYMLLATGHAERHWEQIRETIRRLRGRT